MSIEPSSLPFAIAARPTPNPNARKYVLPSKRFSQPINCSSVDAASAHPLAARLFALEGIYNVLLAQDFVTINKRPDVGWEPLEQQAAAVITDWLAEGDPP
jgi:hypothetical protein